MGTLQAIETQYKDYRFRSRLEARWAVFFDALGLDWNYEPEGYNLGEAGYYLPDFWLPLPTIEYLSAGFFIEIKGVKPTEEYLDKLRVLSVQSKHSVWCFVGEPGKQHRFIAHNSGRGGWQENYECEGCHMDSFTFDLSCTFARFWTCGINQPPKKCNVDYAIRAARSARFEHGETPQVRR